MARTDQNSVMAHEQLLEKARRGGIDVYFAADSITRRWGATDYPEPLVPGVYVRRKPPMTIAVSPYRRSVSSDVS